MHNLIETSTFGLLPIAVPDDEDEINPLHLESPIQELANRTRYLLTHPLSGAREYQLLQAAPISTFHWEPDIILGYTQTDNPAIIVFPIPHIERTLNVSPYARIVTLTLRYTTNGGHAALPVTPVLALEYRRDQQVETTYVGQPSSFASLAEYESPGAKDLVLVVPEEHRNLHADGVYVARVNGEAGPNAHGAGLYSVGILSLTATVAPV